MGCGVTGKAVGIAVVLAAVLTGFGVMGRMLFLPQDRISLAATLEVRCGNKNVSSLTIEEGDLMLIGMTAATDTITFNDCTPDLVVFSSATVDLNVKLSGTNGIVKYGTGTATFSSTSNDFTGNLTIASGTIKLGNSNVIPAGNDVILADGTLDMNGNSETITNLTLTANSTLAFTPNTSGQQLDITALNLAGYDLTVSGGVA